MRLTPLTLASNSEWVASLGPSNAVAKRNKDGVGQEKQDKNAHISTVNTAVLPSLSDTLSLSPSPIYSESSTHLSSESSTSYLLSSSIKSIFPMLQKINISLTSHHIFTDLNIKAMQQEVIEFFPFVGRKFGFKSSFSLAAFSKTTKVEFEEQGPHSMGGVNTTLRKEGLLPQYKVCYSRFHD